MSFEDWLKETDKEIAELQERNRKIIEAKKSEARAREEAYLEMEKQRLEQMQERYNFPLNEELITALERLESLKVNEYRNVDYYAQDSFDRVWWSVLHEVDMYEEGEESPLNVTTLKGAKNWLKSFSHLCKGCRIPKEYEREED